MLIKINDIFSGYSTRNKKVADIDLRIDFNKHYPAFKLFDFNNIFDIETAIKHNKYHNVVSTLENKYAQKDYQKDHLKVFLNEKRDNNTYYYKYNFYHRDLINNIDTICYPLMSNNSMEYYTACYTLGLKDKGFIYLLCVKPEYIYYVKLCILAKVEPEFDCFYIIAKNNSSSLCDSVLSIKIYNKISKAIKNYKIPVIYVDSIEDEIRKNIDIPKFNTIKERNEWLESIKNKFIENI